MSGGGNCFFKNIGFFEIEQSGVQAHPILTLWVLTNKAGEVTEVASPAFMFAVL